MSRSARSSASRWSEWARFGAKLRRLAVCGLFVVGGGSGCRESAIVPPTASIPGPRPVVPEIPPPAIASPTREPAPWPANSDPGPSDERSTTLNEMAATVRDSSWTPVEPPRDWKYIVLHHTAAPAGDVESIDELHRKNKDKHGNPWLGIGYHFVVGNGQGMPDGAVEATFRWRGQLAGAHAGVGNYNQQGIGIVLVGNFEETAPTAAQLAAVKCLVNQLATEYRIRSEHVIGHGDVKATACPGQHFPLSEVRDSVLTAIRTDGPAPAESVALWKPRKETQRP